MEITMNRYDYYNQLLLPGFTPKMQLQLEHKPGYASDLPEDMQEEIAKRHSEFNVHDGWWDPEFEGFKEDMKEIGLSVSNIYFSGFWSQGDGACFECTLDNSDKFIQYLIDHGALPTVVKLKWLYKDQRYRDALSNLVVTTKQSGRYYHSGCMDIEVDFGGQLFYGQLFDDQLYDDNDEVYDMLTQEEYNELEKFITEDLKHKADELYKTLQEEYTYLTTTAAICEGLDNCDYKFWANGQPGHEPYDPDWYAYEN